MPIISVIQAYGQITLSPTDLPGIGDVQISVKVDSLQAVTLDPSPAGENLFWDFSNLLPCCGIPNSQDTIKWMDPRDVDPGNNFPDATLATNTHCYTYHSHITHQDVTVCYHDFFFKDSQGLWRYGTDDPVHAIGLEFQLIQPVLSFGQSVVIPSRMVFDLSSDSLKTVTVLDSIMVDAWGTLINPIDTFSTLRIRTVENVVDSLFVNGTLASVVHSQGISWRWFANGLRFPVLQIGEGNLSSRSGSRSVEYSMKSYNAVGINETSPNKNDLTVFPNPFNQTVTFRFRKDVLSEKFNIIFYDIMGKQVLQVENVVAEEIRINRENLQPGTYLYRVFDANSLFASGKVIIN